MNDFAIFILTHGRPDNMITLKTLQKAGYSGNLYYIIDNEDETADRYYENFGDQVIMFDKTSMIGKEETGDNFNHSNLVVYARNKVFDIAEGLGIKYFLVLDDDYTAFDYRMDYKGSYTVKPIGNIDSMIKSVLKYYKSISATSIALAQGGDFIGGKDNNFFTANSRRKCMNTFFCSTDRKFKFMGSINEDVNAYTLLGSQGHLFLTIPFLSITQKVTQSNPGGLTDIYLERGTYIKSFYSVIFSPSCVKVSMIRGQAAKRLHHRVDWKSAVPLIIREEYKK